MMPQAPLIGIVDDDKSICHSLSSLLRSAQYRSAAFACAELLLRSRELSEFGCLILDYQLPGASGLELQRRLWEAKCAIPIIFITAHSDRVAEKAIHQGAIAVFGKPFSDEALLGAIDAALHQSSPQRAAP